jgi:hypothetical protein
MGQARKAEMLSEHIWKMLEILREEGDMELVYAHDDEGNSFDKVMHAPEVVIYNNGDYLTELDYNQMKEDDELCYPDNSERVVLIN